MYKLIYREKETDFDCCAYVRIEADKVMIDRIYGASYVCSINKNLQYNQIETYLTEEEFNWLKSGDENHIEEITNRVMSDEADEFIAKIQAEEEEIIKDRFSLSNDDIEAIFEEYSLDYHDRNVVGNVYIDSRDYAEEVISDGVFGNISYNLEPYIDLDRLGDDIVNEDEQLIELADGRIVYVNM